jgi:hypothetical protein
VGNETPGTVPPGIVEAKEINLFLSKFSDFDLNPDRIVSPVIQSAATSDPPYASPALSIFHPPCC